MSFKRIVAPIAFKVGEQLTKDLVGIGFLLSASGNSTMDPSQPHGKLFRIET